MTCPHCWTPEAQARAALQAARAIAEVDAALLARLLREAIAQEMKERNHE
jgi:hypothetical protein